MTSPTSNALSAPIPVVKGTLDLLALKALLGAPKHGFEVTSWIEERSRGSFQFDDSAVYQALYRMEKRGLIEAEWGVTENNRRARYYRLTPQGQEHLRDETEKLLRFSRILTDILTARPQPA